MKKIVFAVLTVLLTTMVLSSCSDNETYADKVNAERSNIKAFIAANHITPISEHEFLTDTTTDVSKNEYVLFDNSGVYMQIVSRGSGEMLPDGESWDVLCRFKAISIAEFPNRDWTTIPDDSTAFTNLINLPTLGNQPDVMTVSNTSGTFTASFTSGYMKTYLGSSVPSGWLVPLSYVRLGRNGDDFEWAHVRLIVPHAQGTETAVTNVTPYFYDLWMMKGE
ncbi:DUF4827 domain-containing protein [Prevotella sp. AGR2160]|uniref:DUF4827 domain-containing protein n=1 Tax=Prevotella sp. AGR2160 TaxID=1280674 RepID=UPI00042A55B0|nr:DUF4827 domain-containing protein [Prevotella sp. AGR2160]